MALIICKKCGKKFRTKPRIKTVCKPCQNDIFRKNGLGAKRKIYPTITKSMKQVILGSILGDGGFECQNKKSKNADWLISIKHCLGQENYLLWKRRKLGRLVIGKTQYPKERVRVRTMTHPFITDLAKQLAKHNKNGTGKKRVRYEIFEQLGPLGFLIWYLDDGNLSVDKRSNLMSIRFSTCSFSEKEINELRRLMHNKLGIKTTICSWRNPRNKKKPYKGIKIGRKDDIKKFFTYLGKTEVQKCMKYKLPFM